MAKNSDKTCVEYKGKEYFILQTTECYYLVSLFKKGGKKVFSVRKDDKNLTRHPEQLEGLGGK